MNNLVLTNFDIFDIYKMFKINLLFCDDYHKINTMKLSDGCYILNLKDQHWTALYVKNNQGCYFDSFGVIYPTDIKKFCKNIIYSEDQIQSLKSVLCGYYCLFFLYWMTNKFKYDFEYTLNTFRALFSDNENQNDKILQHHIKNILMN